MKFCLVASLLSVAAAFAPKPAAFASTTRLHSTVDAASAIQAALEASKTHGASSPEARVAWDAVEEMAAADNSAAFAKSLDMDCLVEEAHENPDCADYGDKLVQLATLLRENKPKLDAMRSMAEEIHAVKMVQPQSVSQPDSPALRQALAEAKAASAQFGPTSPEARVAWDTVEEIAASGTPPPTPNLQDECLVETAMDACIALEELNRVMTLEQLKGDGGLNA